MPCCAANETSEKTCSSEKKSARMAQSVAKRADDVNQISAMATLAGGFGV